MAATDRKPLDDKLGKDSKSRAKIRIDSAK